MNRESAGPVATGSDCTAFLICLQPAALVRQSSTVSLMASLPTSLLEKTAPVFALTM